MRSKQLLLVSMLALTMAACSSTEPTQYTAAASEDDFGYRDIQLEDQKYRVMFKGNEKTDKQTIRDYALLRAANLTLQKGYDYFEIVDSTMDPVEKTRPNSNYVNMTGPTTTSTRCGLLTCTTQTNRPAVTTGVVLSEEKELDYHYHVLTIAMSEKPIEGSNRAFDAQQLSENLSDRI